MNAKKILLPGLAGGIVYFFLGYLFYGILFNGTMTSRVAGVDRPMDQMVWWALIVGNLGYGILLAFIISKSTEISLLSGAITGAIVGFLMSISFDFTMHATTYLLGKKAIMYDIAISTVMSAIVGTAIAFVAGLGNKK